MEKKVLLTMDVEPDMTQYLKNSYIGVEKGLPPFLGLLDDYGITIDFFITADVCKRYSELMKKIADQGHRIGCHGYDHTPQFYCNMSFEKQLRDISEATKEIEKILGSITTMFRTPNFSVNRNTIKALEQLNYVIDSSVLPGRHFKRWKIFPIFDHRNAPRAPYYPSLKDITRKGESSVLEIPLTENPHFKGAPIGMGYLNYAGLKKTIAAINEVESEYVTFLIHPWELVDIKEYHPNLKSWVYNICSSDLNPLTSLLGHIDRNFEFTTLEEVKNRSNEL